MVSTGGVTVVPFFHDKIYFCIGLHNGSKRLSFSKPVYFALFIFLLLFLSCLYYCLTCPWTVPDAPTFFFFEVAVCAFITSLFFFLFSFFKATFTFSSCLYYCLTCPWTVPNAPTFFLRWSSVLFISGFIFQSQSCFLLLLFFYAFILHALDSPGCTNFFFSI